MARGGEVLVGTDDEGEQVRGMAKVKRNKYGLFDTPPFKLRNRHSDGTHWMDYEIQYYEVWTREAYSTKKVDMVGYAETKIEANKAVNKITDTPSMNGNGTWYATVETAIHGESAIKEVVKAMRQRLGM